METPHAKSQLEEDDRLAEQLEDEVANGTRARIDINSPKSDLEATFIPRHPMGRAATRQYQPNS